MRCVSDERCCRPVCIGALGTVRLLLACTALLGLGCSGRAPSSSDAGRETPAPRTPRPADAGSPSPPPPQPSWVVAFGAVVDGILEPLAVTAADSVGLEHSREPDAAASPGAWVLRARAARAGRTRLEWRVDVGSGAVIREVEIDVAERGPVLFEAGEPRMVAVVGDLVDLFVADRGEMSDVSFRATEPQPRTRPGPCKRPVPRARSAAVAACARWFAPPFGDPEVLCHVGGILAVLRRDENVLVVRATRPGQLPSRPDVPYAVVVEPGARPTRTVSHFVETKDGVGSLRTVRGLVGQLAVGDRLAYTIPRVIPPGGPSWTRVNH